jgi:tetratricopeptide (TPR) repeat protein/tRNA A-37 threonylcarbamoyl transferase component Bud32
VTSLNHEPADRDERLSAVLVACLEEADQGRPPDRRDVMARYPEFATELDSFLTDMGRVDRWAAPLRQAAQALSSVAETVASSPEPLPRVIGDYEVLREIGRGGMGAVYAARQTSLNRLVALKTFRAGALPSHADVQRFRNEAEIVARLDHPHIVPVYNVGEQDGQLYFSMKLIEGDSLAAGVSGQGLGTRADEGPGAREKEGTGVGREQQRRAAEVVAAVARAVHHAHQRGVLHRDLKPGNILLDGHGEPHVSDFGLARRVEQDSSLTQPGALVGTPAYMAPEQASGRQGVVTTATDVHGLGAILYFLITGRAPFEGENVLDILARVQDQDPPPPRRSNPAVDRDLETVCGKCLEKEPGRRYGSAEAVAEELERWLAGEPVRARPAGSAERLWRWCRRRPLVAGLAAALMVSLATGLGLAGWQWRRAEEHAARAEAGWHKADQERAQAELNFRQARQAVNDFCARARELPESQPLRKEMLELGLIYYERFAQEHGDDPGVRADLADTCFRIGSLTAAVGSQEKALGAYRRALPLYQELLAADPASRPFQVSLAETQHRIALLLKATGKPEAALTSYREAQARFTRLCQADPADENASRCLAWVCNNVGCLYKDGGHYDDALAYLRQSLTVFEELARRHPDKVPPRHELAICCGNLAEVLAWTGRGAEAVRWYEQARDLREQCVRAEPANRQYQEGMASIYQHLGYQQSHDRQYADALVNLKKSQSILERLLQAEPAVHHLRRSLAATHREVGHAHRGLGHIAEALACYQRSRALMEALVREDPSGEETANELAKCYYDAATVQPAAEAVQSYQRAADIRRPLVEANPDHLSVRNDLGLSLASLGTALGQLGRLDDARNALRQALEHHRRVLARAPEVPWYRKCLSTALGALATVERHAGRPDEAVTLALERQKLWAGDPAHLYEVARDLAQTASQAGAPRRAAVLAVNAIRQAAACGFHDVGRLRTDATLDPLRQRDDFRKLLDELDRHAESLSK